MTLAALIDPSFYLSACTASSCLIPGPLSDQYPLSSWKSRTATYLILMYTCTALSLSWIYITYEWLNQSTRFECEHAVEKLFIATSSC